jgi:hypothetical protein
LKSGFFGKKAYPDAKTNTRQYFIVRIIRAKNKISVYFEPSTIIINTTKNNLILRPLKDKNFVDKEG